ncbi:ATP-binding protein, partial [Pricia sp.]|uniref:ATP-binding protein n=1 Tax=Pricia sp. TaxID=2268138 RepID=UPI0035943BD7
EKTENILFFDEADALFGKRTNVRDAHDKYANQEVSYLLQRIESYKGLVILASNMKSNIDEAFVRRFQSIISFPLPKASERLLIWKNAFPSKVRMGKDLDLGQVARKYELSGAEIMNIVQYACLCALGDRKKTITPQYIADGIQREFQKGGRIMR